MKKVNRKKRITAFLAALILAVLSLCQVVYAEPQAEADAAKQAGMDVSRPSALTLDLESREKQATIALYQVGVWDGSRELYSLTGAFASSGVDLSLLSGDQNMVSADDVMALSAALEKFSRDRGLTPLAAGTTTAGTVRFEQLPAGLYLVFQQRAEGDNVTINPFLTTLPVWDEEASSWDYEVTGFPKNQADQPVPPPPTEPNPSRPENPGNPGSSGGGTPSGGGTRGRRNVTINDPGTPLATIDDGGVPLGDSPLMETIEDMLVPLAALPKTADAALTYGTLLTAMMVSGMLIILLLRKRWKAEEYRV